MSTLPSSMNPTRAEQAAAGLLCLLEDSVRKVVREEVAGLSTVGEPVLAAPEGWMSVETAAAYLDLTPAALRARVARGEVTAHRLGSDGRSLRFKREDLDGCVVRIEGKRPA